MKREGSNSEIRFLTNALVQLVRTTVRLRRRWPPGVAGSLCGVTNPIPLGTVRDPVKCYACKVNRESEEHSVVGDHVSPRTPCHPNEHKVLDETQRILASISLPGVRADVRESVAALVASRLTALGTLRGER